MSLTTIAALLAAGTEVTTAAENTTTPGAPAAAALALPPLLAGVDNTLNPNLGLVIVNPTIVGQIPPAVMDSPAESQTALYPYQGIDTFVQHNNDVGEVANSADFNFISAVATSVETTVAHLLRAAPWDLATRLQDNNTRLLLGNTSPQTFLGLGESPTGSAVVLGGEATLTPNTTCAPRRPVLITLSGKITDTSGLITNFNPPPSVSLTLTSPQMTALGWTARAADLRGLVCWGEAKLQKPSVDPTLYDPAAVSARVELVFGTAGTVVAYLCPALRANLAATNSSLYTQSADNVPYLLPGVWYITLTFLLSTYLW